MSVYLAPGVYVEEIDTGSKPIEGVSTSTAGMVGVTERGPVNVPILITSYGEYTYWFGGRLDIDDFSNGNDHHCYLPHAVEGFFTNQGKRVYVTRVIDTTLAQPAVMTLFDRPGITDLSTVLIRAVGQDSGTLINQPSLYLLDESILTMPGPVWMQIGDGSAADYVEWDTTGTGLPIDDVPLNFPLSHSHDVGGTVLDITPANAPGYAGSFQIANAGTPTEAGQATLKLSGAAADISALLATLTPPATSPILQIGTSFADAELRFVTKVVSSGANVMVTLDSPLMMSYPDGTTVQPLNASAAPADSGTLGTAGSAGDTIAFLSGNKQFTTVSDMAVFDPTDPLKAEARRVGRLFTMSIVVGAYAEYARGSVVELVKLGDDSVTTSANAASGSPVVHVNSALGLAAGMTVTLEPGTANAETLTVLSIAPDPLPATTSTITFTGNLAHNHASGITIAAADTALSADAEAGVEVIQLANRLGLSVGDTVRIGVSPDEEYAVVAALPAAGGPAPDAGFVVIREPLSRGYANGTAVRRQMAASGMSSSTTLALPAMPGDTTLVLSDGSGYTAAVGQIIEVTTAQGDAYFHRVLANAVAAAHVAQVNALQPVEASHAAGSIVAIRKPLLNVQALDLGTWGNRLRVAVQDDSAPLVKKTTLANVIDPTHLVLASLAGVEPGTILEFTDPLSGDSTVDSPVKVQSVDRPNLKVVLDGTGLSGTQIAKQNAAVLQGKCLGIRSREFRVTVNLLRHPDPAIPSRNEVVIATEDFRNLSMDPRHSRYVQTIIGDFGPGVPTRLSDGRTDGESWYIRVHDIANDLAEPAKTQQLYSVRLGPELLTDTNADGIETPAWRRMEGGNDSVTTLDDDIYIGDDADDPVNRTGLFSLMNIDEVSVIAAPGRTSATMQGALIAQCELMRYRFAVLDGPPPPDDAINDVLAQRQQFDTKYAALYYPWLLINDPFPQNLNNVKQYPIPPSGHVIGVYARTDDTRGVHKAPANEVVNGILGLQRTLYKAQQEILNPYPVNINVIRDFRLYDRGIVVYGGRVITSDSDWKYVNVRRLLIFIEASIDRGLQWVVFEPNSEPLWARVRRSITDFLTLVWRNGALEGISPDEAFFVKCDLTTMTQTDIDEGRLIVVIGVAPVKPAEFVIVRIGLMTAQAGN